MMESLACSLTDCSFQPPTSHAILLAGVKSALKVLGTNSQPQEIPCWCRANDLSVGMCRFLCLSEWSLCCWHGCGETHSAIPLESSPDRQIPQNCRALSWWDSWSRKGHATGKGRFYGPCLFPFPFGQSWEQSAFHVPRPLLIQP